MITDEQIRYLRQVVSNEFELDVTSKTRTRNHVDARLVYSYILRNRGASLMRIAKSLNKNHATILYLLNNAPSYLKQDPDLNLKYVDCKDRFENHSSPIYDYTKGELQKAYIKLDELYDILLEENENLIDKIKKLESQLDS
jgi:predicted transcriptional regulator